jgi:hypothetical protein
MIHSIVPKLCGSNRKILLLQWQIQLDLLVSSSKMAQKWCNECHCTGSLGAKDVVSWRTQKIIITYEENAKWQQDQKLIDQHSP